LIDPEGDYEGLEHALEIGEVKDVPDPEAVTEILRKSPMSVALNMLGVETKDRPTYYSQLLPALQSLRAQTGRPHVVIVDEAHHVLPAAGAGERTSGVERGMVFVTVELHSLAACVVEAVDRLIAFGDAADEVIASFCVARGLAPPLMTRGVEKGEMLLFTAGDSTPRRLAVIPSVSGATAQVRRRGAWG